MIASRARMPVGSAQWMLNERRQANSLVEQEVEEFSYSARNELEWLNEHMADILQARHLSVTDVFKTPGKLRGKTPRTARKRNVFEARAPLTDIFAPTPQGRDVASIKCSTPAKSPFLQRVEKLQKTQIPTRRSPKNPSSRQLMKGKKNTDSGYHGTTEDEMDLDNGPSASGAMPDSLPVTETQTMNVVVTQPRESNEERDSFVSAEEFKGRTNMVETSDDHQAPSDMASAEPAFEQSCPSLQKMPRNTPHGPEAALGPSVDVHEDAMDVENLQSQSANPSPAKMRKKSSLAFSALPAREPLVSKQSIGNRVSRTSHLDTVKGSHSGHIQRSAGSRSIGMAQENWQLEDVQHGDSDEENFRPALSRMESETTKMHNKTSTQRLHDAISRLGQTKEPRPSKSIPNLSYMVQSVQGLSHEDNEDGRISSGPPVPLKDHVITARAVQPESDEEDDWIMPIKNAVFPQPPGGTSRAQTTSATASALSLQTKPAIPQQIPQTAQVKVVPASVGPRDTRGVAPPVIVARKPIPSSHSDAVQESTTPAGSPARKGAEGPLSMSKAKLFSVLKSAKGIFASSAVTSAQAKAEVLSPKRSHEVLIDRVELPLSSDHTTRPSNHPLYPDLADAVDQSFKPPPSVRRTRSSTEREREEKRKEKESLEQHRMATELERAREKERQNAAEYKSKVQSKLKAASKEDLIDGMGPVPPSKATMVAGSQQLGKSGQPRRMLKPSKETLNKSTGPPKPLTVHLASQRIQHQGQSNMHETFAPAPPVKTRPDLAKSASQTSLASQGGNNSQRGNNQTSRPKALDAAMRKKEIEEKAALRKAEQKRELEQRKAAKLEEERRAEQQRKDEEQRKAAEGKKAAQRKADAQRKQEQQRKDAARPVSRQAQSDLAHALQQDRSQASTAFPRSEVASARPISHMKSAQDLHRPAIVMNTAKPAKRPLQNDGEEEQPAQRPAVLRNPPSFQQLNAKRRKTDEGDEEVDHRRSVMAPPIRQSNIRKEQSKFPLGYTSSVQPVVQSSTLFKSSVTSQQNSQHNGIIPAKSTMGHVHDMSKYASIRVPFSDATNAPSVGPSTITTNTLTYKTPLRPEGAPSTAKSGPRSSPHYPAGESIQLPEIATDSEDEDSENEFIAPSWVASPYLHEALSQQQLVDPESVFGPIAELKMEEIFKNKDRAPKWRGRTSSANWSGADKLTEDERRRDRLAREKLMKQGGWSFDTVIE